MKNSPPSESTGLDPIAASDPGSTTIQTPRHVRDGDNKLKKSIIYLILAGLLLLIGSVLIMSAVPPVSRDALTHHLAVPKLWIKHGGIHEIPNLQFSYAPMNVDLLYALALLLGSDIFPKYIHFLFGLATAWFIYAYLKPRTNSVYAWLGGLIFLSTPVIVKLSVSAYVDLGLVFFSWTSIYFLFKWMRSALSIRPLIAAAALCGLGLGTKYNGLLVFCLLSLFIPLIYARITRNTQTLSTTRSLASLAAFIVVSLAVFSPWMIKNYRWTGNPVYPLYDQVFNDQSAKKDNQTPTMRPWLQRKLIYKETALETALIPVRIFFQGRDDNPQYFDGRLNPLLFIFPFLAFWGYRSCDRYFKTELLILVGFSFLYLLYASFVVDMRIRYIAPIIPPLTVLAVLGIRNVFSFIGERSIQLHQPLAIGLIIVLSILLAHNGFYVKQLFATVAPMDYLNDRLSRAEYIEAFRPEYPVVQTANQLPGEDIKILVLFMGNRRYYFDGDVEFALETFQDAAMMTGVPIAATLSNSGFTHVIVGVHQFKIWAKNTFSGEQIQRINAFFDAGGQITDDKNGYALFEIQLTEKP